MLHTQLQSEVEAQYCKEIQALCKTLESILDVAKVKAPMLTSLISQMGPLAKSSNSASHHLGEMKLVTIFVILCRSAHRNNSNYLPLLIALYLYSAGARVDAITLLNHRGISVFHNTLQQKLKNISSKSPQWIKMQATNPKLVGTWEITSNIVRTSMGSESVIKSNSDLLRWHFRFKPAGEFLTAA